MKTLSLIITLMITCSICQGGETGIQAFFSGPIPVGGTSSKPSVQRDNSENNGMKFDLSYYLGGNNNGFLIGIGHAIEKNLYIYPKSETEILNYESKIEAPYVKAGYWLQTKEKIRVLGSLSIGYGTYEFKEKATAVTYEDEVLNLDVEGRVSYDLEVGKLSFELLGGGGVKKTFVPNFSVNGEHISSSDFDPYPYLQVGVGFRF